MTWMLQSETKYMWTFERVISDFLARRKSTRVPFGVLKLMSPLEG